MPLRRAASANVRRKVCACRCAMPVRVLRYAGVQVFSRAEVMPARVIGVDGLREVEQIDNAHTGHPFAPCARITSAANVRRNGVTSRRVRHLSTIACRSGKVTSPMSSAIAQRRIAAAVHPSMPAPPRRLRLSLRASGKQKARRLVDDGLCIYARGILPTCR